MTDKEIVKAWIVVIENKRMPTEYLINVTIDRINSLTAEVLRQQAEINVKKRLLDKADAEIERLQKENTILSQNADTAFQDGLNEAQDLYAKQVKAEIKAEACREFAERLKEKVKVNNLGDGYVNSWDITETYKELVEEEEQWVVKKTIVR